MFDQTLDLRAEARAVPVAIGDPGWLSPAVAETWRGRMIHEHGPPEVLRQ